MIDRKNVISGGSSGIVVLLSSGNIRKSPYPEAEGRKQSLRDLECEFRIYQRLPSHDRLLRMVSYSPESGLELEDMPAGTLKEHIGKNRTITMQQLQWASDAAEALEILHLSGVIHCDVKPENFLLDSASRLKIIDFSGSSIDGSWASAFESVRFCLPRHIEERSTVRTDLFALGSTIYQIMTGRQPYEDVPDDEVETKFRQQIFPTETVHYCREVIEQCWRGQLKSAGEALELIQCEMKSCTSSDKTFSAQAFSCDDDFAKKQR